MNLEQAVNYLLSLGRELAAPTQAATAKFNLENISVLAEHLGHLDGDQPRNGVGAATRRERNEDANRAVRPGGLPDRRAREARGQRGGG